MRHKKRKKAKPTNQEKYNLTVTALQHYLKEKGEHMGFLEWKKIAVTQNHKAKDQFCNVTVKGMATVENYNRDGIREDVPVNFTYAQNLDMSFSFRDEG